MRSQLRRVAARALSELTWFSGAAAAASARLRIDPRAMPFTIPKETFLYSVAAYGAVHALLFTLKPEIPTMDSFGEDAAKNNKPVKVMTAVMGSMFGVLATASFVLARGHDAAVALHCGLSLLPLRMAYDAFVEKITPPPPAIAMTAAIVGAGFFLKK